MLMHGAQGVHAVFVELSGQLCGVSSLHHLNMNSGVCVNLG